MKINFNIIKLYKTSFDDFNLKLRNIDLEWYKINDIKIMLLSYDGQVISQNDQLKNSTNPNIKNEIGVTLCSDLDKTLS